MLTSFFSRLVTPIVVYDPPQFPKTVSEALAEVQLVQELREIRATLESLARQCRTRRQLTAAVPRGSRLTREQPNGRCAGSKELRE